MSKTDNNETSEQERQLSNGIGAAFRLSIWIIQSIDGH
jgi:hypothetical protein